jgi:hypothetical protein
MNVPADGQIEPTFVSARVGASGEAVLSGRGEPGATVSVLMGGQAIGRSAVSAQGEWTIVNDQPLSPGDHEMGLRSDRPGSSLLSEDAIIVHVSQGGGVPLVLDVRFGLPSRFLQRPDDLPLADLSLDSVDYDSANGVFLSGRAAPGATVRLYLDNQAIGDATATATGDWAFRPREIAAGAYTLRLDQLGLQSIVVARLEVPFERGDAASVAHSLLGDLTLSVQPGESLWRIAREVPDIGYQCTMLYRAAQDQLRDPNLIYPGQSFEPATARKSQ